MSCAQFTIEQKQKAIDRLHDERLSCVVLTACGETFTFDNKGVKDLHNLYTRNRDILRGAFVADKVIGKGAAAILIEGGVTEVYTDVISESAKELIDTSAIVLQYILLVPQIINRTSTDICPIEKLCSQCITANDCIPLITLFLQQTKQ